MMRPLSPGLTAAVLTLAPPYEARAVAPGTLPDLVQCASAGTLAVWEGASVGTIFGAPSANHAFRAWHDMVHLACPAAYTFTLAGERLTCAAQCREILDRFGDNAETRHWCAILRAEVAGQAEYFDRTGRFVTDQWAFTTAYLERESYA